MSNQNGFFKRLKNAARSITNGSIKVAAVSPWPRRLLNGLYLRLPPDHRRLFHAKFSKIFRGSSLRQTDGFWQVEFVERPIWMPLVAGQYWLTWDCAVSIVGHDMEVKQTYEAILHSQEKPDLFVDIGANFGTHSLLFLAHQIRTITFEPNSSCHGYFKDACRLNGFNPNLEPVAVGQQDGEIELSYPKNETWLGSVNPDAVKRLEAAQELVTEKVALRTVDDYLPQIEGRRTLMKIDTEGNELFVLRGAVKTLEANRPMVIFECNRDDKQMEIYEFFRAQNYQMHTLPWNPAAPGTPLSAVQFMNAATHNFIAIP